MRSTATTGTADKKQQTLAAMKCDQPAAERGSDSKTMMSLEGSGTDAKPRQAFSEAGWFGRLHLGHQQRTEAAGHLDLAALWRTAADGEACHGYGDLDYLVGDQGMANPAGTSADEFGAVLTAMIEEHTATHPEMADRSRTLRLRGD